MRIIGGNLRGMGLLTPAGQSTRPTPDMVREALYNIIGADVPGSRFLDLFAGSGAVGLEALSRGAEYAVFVDKDSRSISAIRGNISKAGFTDRARVLRMDAKAALRLLSDEKMVFDIIYIDPPYSTDLADKALARVAESDMLAEAGIIIAEDSAAKSPPEGCFVYREKKYGSTVLTFIAKE